MRMMYCPNCEKLTGFKRSLGFGTFFAVVFTAGFWLLAIPFYPQRCINCGLTMRWRYDPKILLAAAVVCVLALAVIFNTNPAFKQTALSATVKDKGPIQNPSQQRGDITPPDSREVPEDTSSTVKARALPPAYAIGQSFSIGYWSYHCNSAYWTAVLGLDPYSMQRANAAFVVVNVEVRNDDTSASTLPPFRLADEQGRTYDESSAGMFSQGFFSAFEKLNPGVSKRGNIAFDVPPDRRYFLLVSGGMESGKQAIVILPMSGEHSPEAAVP